MLTRLSRRRAGTVASPGALQDAVPSAARPAGDGAESPSCDLMAGEEVLAALCLVWAMPGGRAGSGSDYSGSMKASRVAASWAVLAKSLG